MTVPHNIYIHVPFCVSKCNYCAFFSHAVTAPDWDTYADGITAEINTWGARLGHIDVPTVFFGGGTPSLMPIGAFEEIMNALHTNFNVLDDAEITLESNPGTLDALRLHEFISGGINRLSVGIQSLDDERLRFLGRRHSAHDAIQLLDTAMSNNIRVSGDFIYGLPGDTVHDVIETCKQINSLGLRHCSMYELTIEENTPFGKMRLHMPSNDEMADMYCAISDTLHIPRYEVSNYATPGNACRHNQNVWDGAPYIGIGRGAAGRIYMNNTWYEQRGANAEFSPMTTRDRAVEKIITGMRTTRGVKLTPDVLDIINMDFVKSHPELITINDGRIAVTNSGLLILDDLVIQLIG
ncbi:MAG: radical SAM family heme chaperone HemW [Muribaculaceae bacterium]|nr:radical SAM family heme chaperone HemW [Muribaculaceae bacterium]